MRPFFLNMMLSCYWEINITLMSRINNSFIFTCVISISTSTIQWYNGFKQTVKIYWIKQKIGFNSIASCENAFLSKFLRCGIVIISIIYVSSYYLHLGCSYSQHFSCYILQLLIWNSLMVTDCDKRNQKKDGRLQWLKYFENND